MARRLEGAAREALLRRRGALLGLREEHRAREDELLAEREPDPGDVAAVRAGADSLEALSASELRELREVQRALRRIEDGVYGACVECGGDIGGRRLEAVPWASCCLECAEEREAQSSRAALAR